MSSQALEVLSALEELPIYLKRFIDTVYALAVAFVNFFNILEGSGLKKATTRAISRRLKSLHSSNPLSTSALPFTTHPDAHTSSLPRKTSVIYADYAGAPPYSISAVKSATEELLNGVWGNPHSDNGWETVSMLSTITTATASASSSSAAADRLRQLTLEMCQADPNEYVCILTSGATAALKLVAESFPWSNGIEEEKFSNIGGGSDSGGKSSSGSQFLYLSDNHNSVLGIREVAALHGASTQCIHPSDIKFLSCLGKKERMHPPADNIFDEETQHLFAFPLESNFSGTRYSENLVLAIQNQTIGFSNGGDKKEEIEKEILSSSQFCTNSATLDITKLSKSKGRWRVLIDAAKACATHPPNLSHYPADFVALSYYKIFGYPSGLGALLVRRDALCMLRKTYFGGGTVLSSSAEDRFHALRPGYAGFEDGTLPFLAIPAVLHSFSAWTHRGGFPSAEKAAHTAASQFARKLIGMKHGNGRPVGTIYGQWNNQIACTDSSNNKNERNQNFSAADVINGQGPTVTFNLLDPTGNWVGHRQVQRIASLEGIYLRTGVMCNPGACSTATGVKAVQAKTWFENGHVCWDDQDVLDGVPTGAVRVSFGWGSSVADAEALAEFVKRHFVCSSFVVEKEEEEDETVMVENNKENLKNKLPKHDDLRIYSLTIYPIKSAAGFSPRSWPISSSSGLLFDRHWAVVDAHGSILTLKKCPQLSSLHPVVYLEDKAMRIHAKGMKSVLEIPLPDISNNDGGETAKMKTTFSTSSSTSSMSSEWLTEALGIPCSLVEYQSSKVNKLPKVSPTEKQIESNKIMKHHHHGFSNEAQILLVTVASLQALYTKSEIESSFEKFAARFRPNVIVEEKYLPSTISVIEEEGEIESGFGERAMEGGEAFAQFSDSININTLSHSSEPKEDEMLAFEEEQWSSVTLHSGNTTHAHSLTTNSNDLPTSSSSGGAGIECEVVGCCPRCEMICIDPVSGIREGSEPLLTLAKERKGAGKKRFCFGVLLNVKARGSPGGGEEMERKRMNRLAVGMHVNYETK